LRTAIKQNAAVRYQKIKDFSLSFMLTIKAQVLIDIGATVMMKLNALF
jgi:hypothetical protein